MIIDLLRNATKDAHHQLDHLLFPYIQAIGTMEQYIQLLTVFYGYMKPVQGLIDQHLDGELVANYAARRKPERILEDIKTLTGDAGNILCCWLLPEIKSSAAAFGAYYAIEGSIHGGPIISKKIAENLGLNNGKGFSFFAGYGNDNVGMWNSFLESLEQYPANHSHPDLLIQSARETFIAFKNWVTIYYDRKT